MEAHCWSSLIMHMTFDLYWLEIEACNGVNSDRLNKLLSYNEKGIFAAIWGVYQSSPLVQSSDCRWPTDWYPTDEGQVSREFLYC